MPRAIDHSARRTDLLAAVWRLVLRGGVAEASVRKVAAEAGLSAGSVRHVFADQSELLHAAVRDIVRRAGERIRAGDAHRRQLLAEGRTAEAVTQLLAQTLPLDEERRTEARVWFAFTAHDAADHTMQAIRRELDDQVHALGEQSVAALDQAGGLGAGRDPRTETTILVAVLDGLTLRLLLGPDALDPGVALHALHTHVAQLANPAPPQTHRSRTG